MTLFGSRPLLTMLGLMLVTGIAAARGLPPLLGLDLYRPVPDANPLSDAKIRLGKRLFHERRLSRNGTMSCAACHDPKRAFANNLTVAEGIGGTRGMRNVPAIINRAWGTSFFWDGRATSLEQQVLQPLLNAEELGMTTDGVLAVVNKPDYRGAFDEAFGRAPALDDLARAIASYVRTIVAGNSSYDRYVAGNRRALSPSAARGLTVFRGRGNCTSCHVGPTFSDEQFHNTGIAWRTGTLTDEGRARISQKPADRGAFKTPTLRELPKTAPYMHDGSFASIQAVVDFYDEGGGKNPGLDAVLRPLKLSAAEKQDLVAFLSSLSGTVRDGQ